MSSDELYRNGVANAGIYDIQFALQWVQEYIGLFGGNASQVTISGESAGGGAVMLMDIAYGGTLGTSLFVNVRALFLCLFLASQLNISVHLSLAILTHAIWVQRLVPLSVILRFRECSWMSRYVGTRKQLADYN